MTDNTRVFRHKEKFDKKKVWLVSLVSFLLGISDSFLVYVMPFYFKESIGSDSVGIFYFVAYSIIFLLLLNFHKIIKKFGKSGVIAFSFLVKIVSMAFLIILPISLIGSVIIMLLVIFSALSYVALDNILESFSEDRSSGRIRGMHLTLIGIGFMFGPYLSFNILDHFGFTGIFFLLLIVHSLTFVLTLIGFHGYNEKFQRNVNLKNLLHKIRIRKDISQIYYISLILEIFFAIMVIFVPLHLNNLGFELNEIGIAFTLMLIPFVVLQYPVGVLADKKMGEKEMIILALCVIVCSLFFVFYVESKSVLLWSLILIFTRIGAALLDTLRDSYFYKRIDGNDVELINFYRTGQSLAYIFVAIISSVLFVFLPLRFIFFALAIIVLTAFYPAIILRDNKGEAELARGK